ncbi:MAG: DUF72 domain-containing protein [Deltaproteobacteria bacterium]|nr:DUF72 domain-containing protein [Deltaproteobacteria bacterium]
MNSAFYGLPEDKTLKDCTSTVPEGFIFPVKASRFITHNKKLKDPRSTLPPFFNRVDGLGVKLGPVLFQLPPSWNLNVERLEEFLICRRFPAASRGESSMFFCKTRAT